MFGARLFARGHVLDDDPRSAFVHHAAQTSGQPGQSLTFVLNGYDPAPGMQLNGFVFRIKWGDGKTDAVTALNGTTINHTYASTGTYVIQVTATDGRGSTLPTGTWTVVISSATTPNARLAAGVAGAKQSPVAEVAALAAAASSISSRAPTTNTSASSSVSGPSSVVGSTTTIPAVSTAVTTARSTVLDAVLAEWIASQNSAGNSLDYLAPGGLGYEVGASKGSLILNKR